MNEPQPTTVEGGPETPPQFDRVADVLGPLERVVLAADQRLGAIQQLVTTQAAEAEAEVERRVREAAVEQRRRVAQLRQDLTGRRSEVTARFDAIFELLDEVDRDLAQRAGEAPAPAPATEPVAVPPQQAAAPAPPPPPQQVAASPAQEPRKEKGLRRWLRLGKR